MAEAVVSFLVERVGDFIIQEGRSLSGVRDQVERAHTDLVFIKGFLKDADAKRRDSEAIRIFVARIRDAAYDLEDVIEAFVLKVDSKRKGGLKNVLKRLGCIFIEGVRRHKIGLEIGVITTTISDLKQNLQAYGIKEIRESGGSTSLQWQERQQQLRRTYSHVVNRNVVGLEESVHELVGHLVKEEHRHRVVSIWGMGGSGKSTLAREVYHHKDVMQHFDCFAWVCISQQYQVRDVWESIYVKLISATDEQRKEIARLKDDEIPGRLSCLQNERKCLIVLDDIWKTETWDFLKAAFQHDEKSKSKILLTTRNKNVALHADVNGFQYQPPPLNATESWELFERIAMCGSDDAIGMDDGFGFIEIELPREIGKMVHLRFLSLRNSNIKSFPPFLGNLICLQTLDFRVRDGHIFIPNVICKMNKLRHLYLPWRYRARGNLRKLNIRLSSSQSKNLEKILDAAGSVLNGIRSLQLDNDVGSGAEVSQIVARCGQIYKLELMGPTLELPKEFHSYSNLTKLLLRGCALKDDQMAVLEKLPNLKSLQLWENVFEENTKVLVFSAGSFPRLQFLELFGLKGITEWRVEEGAMPCLCKLVIEDGLRHLTTLKELKIVSMPKLFCSKLEEGGEDFHKVQHIPSLIIQHPID